MKVREILRIMEEDGWSLVRTRGSHRHYHYRFKQASRSSRRRIASKNVNQYLEASGFKMSMRHTMVIEHGANTCSAYALGFPACVGAAAMEQETVQLMKKALETHIEDTRGRGERIPQTSEIREIEVAA